MGPASTEKNIKSVENVQRQAAPFVKGDYHRPSSVTTMLESLNWVSLASRRAEAKLVMLYRIGCVSLARENEAGGQLEAGNPHFPC